MSLSIQHLVIIGTGLIGGSLALALKQAGVVKRITGVGRSPQNLHDAIRLGVIDDASDNIQQAVQDADMVLLAVPVAACAQVFKDIADALPEHAIITDAGSTKQSVIKDAQKSGLDMSRFVPAHPIAGTEHSGAAAAFPTLFQNHRCILTPSTETSAESLAKVREMWKYTGANIEIMDAKQHDDIMASISHLPHLTAFSLINALHDDDVFRFAAGGFRDFTRIASSSPEMWRDIALCNAAAITDKIDALQHELHDLRQALQTQNGEALLQKFTAAKQARDQWLSAYGDNI
ncbi:MAG: prephenate dehydrogenase/arogenate dehydrogenase family protein [Zetaproteobacteria bacterium]|nr:prephenate dehydrogenase/arogenate dehydrogenase family protein [Zetaproteobacteria bacterium]